MPRKNLRLSFDDPVLEDEFVRSYDEQSLLWIRFSAAVGIFLGAAFAGIDALVAEENLLPAELIRAVLVLGSCVLVACTYTSWWPRHQRNLSVAPIVLWNWSFAFMTVIAGFPSLYLSLSTAMYMSWLPALFRANMLRTAIGSVLMVGALVWALAYESAPAEIWALNLAFMVNFFCAAVLIAYLLESGARRAFLQKRLVRRYVPPTVAAAIETGKSESIGTPHRRRVTVLFSDIVGFTDTADSMDPESLAEIVNEYLAVMADIVERHGGTLNEFAGDGVMALFGAPAELGPGEQVAAAIAAATEIQGALPRLNDRWAKIGLDHELKTRIGINTGMLSVGTFGSEGRATYTGIGLQTNIAARIQGKCDPGSILVSHASWQLVRDTIPCEERGEAEVKGVHFPIKLYTPVASVPIRS